MSSARADMRTRNNPTFTVILQHVSLEKIFKIKEKKTKNQSFSTILLVDIYISSRKSHRPTRLFSRSKCTVADRRIFIPNALDSGSVAAEI